MSGATEPQTTERVTGYGCICGYKTTDKTEITSHVMHDARKDGKGTHKSLGRIDMESGEVVMPPDAERTKEQRKQAKYKVADNSGEIGVGGEGLSGGGSDRGAKGGGGGGSTGKTPIVQATQKITDASQLRVVPKIFTADYTPIMRIAQDAATKYFGWRPDMPFENFIDTCLYLFFMEKGITLCGYVVDNSLLGEKEEQNNGS